MADSRLAYTESRLAAVQNTLALEAVLGKLGFTNAKGRNAGTARQAQTLRRKQRELLEKAQSMVHQAQCSSGRTCAAWNVCSIEYPGVPQNNLFVLSAVYDLNLKIFTWVESIENKLVTTGATTPYKCGAIEKNLYLLNAVQAAHLIRTRQVTRPVALRWLVMLSKTNANMKVLCQQCGCLYSKRLSEEHHGHWYCLPCCGKMSKPDGRVAVPKFVAARYEGRAIMYQEADLESLFAGAYYMYQPAEVHVGDSRAEVAPGARLVSFSQARASREIKEKEAEDLNKKKAEIMAQLKHQVEVYEAKQTVELLKANPLVQKLLAESVMSTYSPAVEALESTPSNFSSWVKRGLDAGHSPQDIFLSPGVGQESGKDDGKPEQVDFAKARASLVEYAERCQTIDVPRPKVTLTPKPAEISMLDIEADTDDTSNEDYDPFNTGPSTVVYMEQLKDAGMEKDDEDDILEPPAKRSKVVLTSRANIQANVDAGYAEANATVTI
jgi:hypothetical protein